jgi:hypothetical protein
MQMKGIGATDEFLDAWVDVLSKSGGAALNNPTPWLSDADLIDTLDQINMAETDKYARSHRALTLSQGIDLKTGAVVRVLTSSAGELTADEERKAIELLGGRGLVVPNANPTGQLEGNAHHSEQRLSEIEGTLFPVDLGFVTQATSLLSCEPCATYQEDRGIRNITGKR